MDFRRLTLCGKQCCAMIRRRSSVVTSHPTNLLEEVSELAGELVDLLTRSSYAFHLILHPMDGLWSAGTCLPANTVSIAARRSAPVTGTPLLGRLASNWPR